MLCRARSTAASSWTRARRPKRRAGRCGRSALWPQRASSLAPLRSLSARGRPHRRSLLSRCGDPSHLIPSSDDLQCHQSSGLATSRRTRRAQPRARAARRTLTRVAVVESSWACQTLSASSDVIMSKVQTRRTQEGAESPGVGPAVLLLARRGGISNSFIGGGRRSDRTAKY